MHEVSVPCKRPIGKTHTLGDVAVHGVDDDGDPGRGHGWRCAEEARASVRQLQRWRMVRAAVGDAGCFYTLEPGRGGRGRDERGRGVSRCPCDVRSSRRVLFGLDGSSMLIAPPTTNRDLDHQSTQHRLRTISTSICQRAVTQHSVVTPIMPLSAVSFCFRFSGQIAGNWAGNVLHAPHRMPLSGREAR